MRRLLVWSGVAGFTACLLQPTLVSITPDYGYVDGCVDVTIGGHHLGTDGKAWLAKGAKKLDLEGLTAATEDKQLEDHAQDVGFEYTARIPPEPDGESGWWDVVLEVEGEELTIRNGWYYRACPASFMVEQFGYANPENPANGLDAEVGTSIPLQGCGLDADVTMQFLDAYGAVAGTAPMESDCTSVLVHAVIPDLPPGDYTMKLVHTDGTELVMVERCQPTPETGDSGIYCPPDVITISARRGAE